MGFGEFVEEVIVVYWVDYSVCGWVMNSLFDGIGLLLVDLCIVGVWLVVVIFKVELIVW